MESTTNNNNTPSPTITRSTIHIGSVWVEREYFGVVYNDGTPDERINETVSLITVVGTGKGAVMITLGDLTSSWRRVREAVTVARVVAYDPLSDKMPMRRFGGEEIYVWTDNTATLYNRNAEVANLFDLTPWAIQKHFGLSAAKAEEVMTIVYNMRGYINPE